MDPYLNSPFEVLIDATGFTLANAIPIYWISQLFRMIFNEMNDYLVAIHIYNPSTHLQRHLSKLPRHIVNKIIKKLYFYSNLNELYENFSLSEFKLSKMTCKQSSTLFFILITLIHSGPGEGCMCHDFPSNEADELEIIHTCHCEDWSRRNTNNHSKYFNDS